MSTGISTLDTQMEQLAEAFIRTNQDPTAKNLTTLINQTLELVNRPDTGSPSSSYMNQISSVLLEVAIVTIDNLSNVQDWQLLNVDRILSSMQYRPEDHDQEGSATQLMLTKFVPALVEGDYGWVAYNPLTYLFLTSAETEKQQVDILDIMLNQLAATAITVKNPSSANDAIRFVINNSPCPHQKEDACSMMRNLAQAWLEEGFPSKAEEALLTVIFTTQSSAQKQNASRMILEKVVPMTVGGNSSSRACYILDRVEQHCNDETSIVNRSLQLRMELIIPSLMKARETELAREVAKHVQRKSGQGSDLHAQATEFIQKLPPAPPLTAKEQQVSDAVAQFHTFTKGHGRR